MKTFSFGRPQSNCAVEILTCLQWKNIGCSQPNTQPIAIINVSALEFSIFIE